MSCGGGGGRDDSDRCSCGKAGGVAVNLQRMSSIVRDIGEPCLSQSPIKVSVVVSPLNIKPRMVLLFDFCSVITVMCC